MRIKLDRTAHRTYNFKNQLKESAQYANLTIEELASIFNYLQSVAYNFKLNNYPKMDKTIQSYRSLLNKDLNDL